MHSSHLNLQNLNAKLFKRKVLSKASENYLFCFVKSSRKIHAKKTQHFVNYFIKKRNVSPNCSFFRVVYEKIFIFYLSKPCTYWNNVALWRINNIKRAFVRWIVNFFCISFFAKENAALNMFLIGRQRLVCNYWNSISLFINQSVTSLVYIYNKTDGIFELSTTFKMKYLWIIND